MNPRLLFRIFYTTFFTILSIVLFGLILITPADAIHQALDNGQIYNVFVIAGCYFVTVCIAIVIYAFRLYTNRSVLSAIPKTWIPIEKGEVTKGVRKMIMASLSRSIAIAWRSRPRIASQPTTIDSELDAQDNSARVPEQEVTEKRHKRERGFLHRQWTESEKDEQVAARLPNNPVWGEIAHNGWSSPTSLEMPNLQYTTVILELPHLIEARAVSMAPQDPESISDPPMPDLLAVDLLQRPASMCLRDYINHLTSVGVFTSPSPATQFLEAYEYARFSTIPLTESEFRNLMAQFAEVLRNMQQLSLAVLESLDIEPPESDIDDDASSTSTPRSRSTISNPSPSSRSGSEGTIRTAPSRRPGTNGTSTTKHPEFSTAPATPRSRKSKNSRIPVVSRSPSINSFAQSRRLYNGSSAGSSESLRSSSQGSVIRLSNTNEDHDLPYTLIIPATR